MKAFYQSSAPSLIIDRDDRSVVEVNESFLKIFEYAREEVIGFTAAGLNLYQDPAERAGVLQILDERGSLRDYEFTGQTKTGRVVKLLLSAVDVAFDLKHYIVVSGMDITDRKQAEERLKKSEAMLARAQEIARIGHWERDIASQKVLWSDETYRIFGFKPQGCEVNESLFLEHIHPEDRTRVENNLRDAIENDRPLDDEYRIVRSDGTVRWLRGKGEVTRTEDGTPVRLFGTTLDVTERREAEDKLRESEEKYRVLVERADDGIILVQDAVMMYVNPRMAELLGTTVEELTGSLIAEYIDPIDVERVTGRHRRRLAGEDLPSIYEVLLKRTDGRSVETELNVGVVTYQGRPATQVIIRDITERKRMERELLRSQYELEQRVEERTEELQNAYNRLLSEIRQRHLAEEQLIQTQKMEAVGNLAGGIAHDFNNMLAVIIGNAELALDDVQGPPRHFLKQILKASERSRDLVRQILTFTRKNEAPREVMHLTPLLKETAKLLRGSLPSTIHIRLSVRTDQDTILANTSQMQQVLMNLATNAAHAMEHGGELAIRLMKVKFEEGERLPHAELPAGRYLKIRIRDTGAGIPEDIRPRIFEPFFTTKEQGEGSGMGLAVVFGIVKGHDGAITVVSRQGRGSAFSVYLPVVRSAVQEEPVQSWTLPRGKERILVIDDEPLVVEMTSETLTRLGYTVTGVESGPEGWQKYEHDPYQFDLVITDHVMPEITGMRLAAKMLEVRSDLPIILSTGYSEMVSPEKAKSAGIREFLMKPLMVQELAYIVRRVLDMQKSTA
jgi:PAS domain S-box-containing protein